MNETMKANSTLVMAIRDLARELLRARWISNILQEVMHLNGRITEENGLLGSFNKRIAQANYNISILDKKNPSYEDLLKNENESIAYCNESIKNVKEVIVGIEKRIAEENATITKIESGELKVTAENLDVKAKDLLESYYSQKVTEIEA